MLERAVATYRGEQQDRWDDVWPDEAYAHCVSAEIRASLHPLTRARLNERKT